MTPDEMVLALMTTSAGRHDPYPLYQTLRETAPIARSELAPIWYLSRFDDCQSVLRDQRFGKSDPDQPTTLMPGRPPRRRLESARASMLMVNPPDHTRLRGLVSREFTPRRVEQMRASVEAICDEILDGVADAGGCDIMDTLAFPLPVRVIGELLGVPREERDSFRPLVLASAKSIEPDVSEEDQLAANVASQQQAEYFADLIKRRAAEPGDDLLSALIEVRDGSDQLSEVELIATAILLFAAGFETTTNLIGNGLVTLLRNPDQLRLLREDRGRIPTAVEEILRYESPVQLDLRVAFEDVTLDGNTIKTGDAVVTLLGAANRDPSHYERPEEFDVTRGGVPIMSFASGIHFCLGANLARMEGQAVLGRLFDRFSTIEWLDDEPAWRDRLTLRGLEHLNVRVGVR